MSDIEQRIERIEAENDRLRTRVDELEETVAVEDAEGRTVTLPTLESYGLTRRQALSAMALLTAGGYTLSGAIVEVVRGASTSSGRYAAKAMQTREIRDENDNIAIDLPGNGSATISVLNTADATAAAQGEVLQKGASGTDLTFGAVGGNVPNWEVDGNSPFTASGVSSKQFTLASDWDRVMLLPAKDNTGYDEIQVNGDTGTNYVYVDNADNATGSASQWSLGRRTKRFHAIFVVADQGSGNIQLGTIPTSGSTGFTVGGRNSNASPPINTLTFSESSGSNRSVDLEVYGLNVG